MFVAFSCKQRCTCPSCHQKRTLLTAIHVAEEVCFPVAHRQVVLTIPKRLRLHTRFDRKLLGKLSSCARTCLKAEAQRMLGRRRAPMPGARVTKDVACAPLFRKTSRILELVNGVSGIQHAKMCNAISILV